MKTPSTRVCRHRLRRSATCRNLLRCTQCDRVLEAAERVGRCQSCRRTEPAAAGEVRP